MRKQDNISITQITTNVLDFYREFPFNLQESVDFHVSRIKSKKIFDDYPVLKPLLKRRNVRVFDVGCGIGWLSNSIAWHCNSQVTAIDFNPEAVARARRIANALGVDVHYEVADLFAYEVEAPADVAISLGVMHHTTDSLGAVRRMFDAFTAPGGYALIGLYHAHSRKPFLDYFAALKAKGLSEEALLDHYRHLDRRHTDETQLRSWFRDQVLHPYETQHTLAELLPVMADCGMSLEATSINRFRPFKSVDVLLEQERTLSKIAKEQLEAGIFYPGFFLILARKIS